MSAMHKMVVPPTGGEKLEKAAVAKSIDGLIAIATSKSVSHAHAHRLICAATEARRAMESNDWPAMRKALDGAADVARELGVDEAFRACMSRPQRGA